MTKFTLCLPYWNAPQMLTMQYDTLRSLPAEIQQELQVIVCDDASDQPAFFPCVPVGVPLRIFRISGKHIPWSHRCASNIAAHHAVGGHILLTDMDHLVPLETWRYLLDMPTWTWDTVFRFSRRDMRGRNIKAHPDSWLFHWYAWETMGGYDERFRGLYGANGLFTRRVRHYLGEPHLMPCELVLVGPDDVPDCTVPEHARGDRASDKIEVSNRYRQYRLNGTLFEKHALTVPFTEVHP